MVAPSIFNDVIGPVMRGPSSSHCAAALRIGRLARDLMDGQIASVRVEYDLRGSLATTHTSQGSDMGMAGGLMGWDATDPRLVDYAAGLERAGIRIEYQIADLGELGAQHPNTYKLTLRSTHEQHTMIALSTGGGMIQVVEIDGCPVSVLGDCYETLFFLDGDPEPVVQALSGHVSADSIHIHRASEQALIEAKTTRSLPPEIAERMETEHAIRSTKYLSPVLPVLTQPNTTLPFLTCAEMLAYNEGRDLDLWELAVRYESARSGLAPDQVLTKMGEIVRLLDDSIREGTQGTCYADRILGPQAKNYLHEMSRHTLLRAGVLDHIIVAVTALMEVKSAMGVIVAAPTAGACGALPGACLAATRALGRSMDDAARAMLAAGLIGVLFAHRSTFAAEVGGCQSECGAGSGMAAAALVTLAGGSTQQAVDAASMALQNVMGLVCDPVANRVEVPCLGRNVMAASNALACANMALAGYDAVIPLDEVLAAMDEVGRSLPAALRCTALGGLSVTPTSRAIEARLEGASEKH